MMNEAATFYYNQGCNVIPINGHTKKPYIEWKPYQEERIQQDKFDQWIKKGLFNDGIALICGYNGIHAIDIDNKDIVKQLGIDLQKFADLRYWVEETARGYHIIARTLNPVPPYTHDGGIDYLGRDRLCIVAPSPGKKLIGIDAVPQLPDLIIDDELYATYQLFQNKLTQEKKTRKDFSQGVKKGDRNNAMFVLACRYRDQGKPESEILVLIREANKNNTPPLPDEELLTLLRSAMKYPENKKYSDVDKLDLLFQYGAFFYDENDRLKINSVNTAKILLEADDETYVVMSDNQDILRYNGSYYVGNAEPHLLNRINHYLGTRTTNRLKQEIIGYIKNTDYTDRDDFEQPPHLLNFKNGILNIETDDFIEHAPEYTFMSEIPTNYDKNAVCPLWEKFIEDVVYPEDKEFMQEITGYLLYRCYKWALLLIMLGHGRNGKTTFINVITTLMGKGNVQHIPLQTLAHDQHARVRLYQKYANMCSEIGSREIKDTSNIKSLTGGDRIYARELYKNGFEFLNFGKLYFACNILPKIDDDTLAMLERLAVIEFPNTFKRGDPNCDPDLYDKLTTPKELSGILNWMITGLKRLLKNKKFSDFKTFEKIEEYQKKCQDTIYNFIQEQLEPNKDSVIKKRVLYTHYKKYCETQKPQAIPLNDVWFGRKLKQFLPTDWNVESGQTGKTTWKGIKLKSSSEHDDEEKIDTTSDGTEENIDDPPEYTPLEKAAGLDKLAKIPKNKLQSELDDGKD